MKLRVSLDNLLVAEQVGRWWIVGSSWSGAPMINEQRKAASKETPAVGQVQKPSNLYKQQIIEQQLLEIGLLSSIFFSSLIFFISVVVHCQFSQFNFDKNIQIWP